MKLARPGRGVACGIDCSDIEHSRMQSDGPRLRLIKCINSNSLGVQAIPLRLMEATREVRRWRASTWPFAYLNRYKQTFGWAAMEDLGRVLMETI